MQLTIKGTNVEVTDSLREHIEKRLKKLQKYSDSIISVDVTCSTERNWHNVEISLHISAAVFRAEDKSDDMYVSVDGAVDKLEKQLKKQKDKFTRKPRTSGNVAYKIPVGLPAGGNAEEEEDEFTEESLNEDIQIVRRFNPKPMQVKDAIMAMNASDHGFFVFVNDYNNRVNVVYRREDGYGLIDPVID